MTDSIKYVVVLRKGSETEVIFGDDHDAKAGSRVALYCTALDLSGFHARVVRVPAPTSRAAIQGSNTRTYWFPTSDVAFAFEVSDGVLPPEFAL
jgi:UDP-glucose 4-epimerase